LIARRRLSSCICQQRKQPVGVKVQVNTAVLTQCTDADVRALIELVHAVEGVATQLRRCS
jgi:hypothetical protein